MLKVETLEKAILMYKQRQQPRLYSNDKFAIDSSPIRTPIYTPDELVYIWAVHLPKGLELALINYLADQRYSPLRTAFIFFPLIRGNPEEFQNLTYQLWNDSATSIHKVNWLETASQWLKLPDDILPPTLKENILTFLVNEITIAQESPEVQAVWLQLLSKPAVAPETLNEIKQIRLTDAVKFFHTNPDTALNILLHTKGSESEISADPSLYDSMLTQIHAFLSTLAESQAHMSQFRKAERCLDFLPLWLTRLPSSRKLNNEVLQMTIESRMQTNKFESLNLKFSEWDFWFESIIKILDETLYWVPPNRLLEQWFTLEQELKHNKNPEVQSWYSTRGKSYFETISKFFERAQRLIQLHIAKLDPKTQQVAFQQWNQVTSSLLAAGFTSNPESMLRLQRNGKPRWINLIGKYRQLCSDAHINLDEADNTLMALLAPIRQHFANDDVFWSLCEDNQLVDKEYLIGNQLGSGSFSRESILQKLRAQTDPAFTTFNQLQITLKERSTAISQYLAYLQSTSLSPTEQQLALQSFVASLEEPEATLEPTEETKSEEPEQGSESSDNCESFTEIYKQLREDAAQIRKGLQQKKR